MQRNPVVVPSKGSKKPIRSHAFRERFQVDLIDMTKLRKKNPYGVLMRWIVTVKDHSTGLVHLSAIPRKRPSFVAHELEKVFGFIGYPSIFHTDNGKEFTGVAILKLLRQMNPNILSVTGRPRTPRDQGSVENMNRIVKRVLRNVVAERRLAGENCNWTELLGSVMAAINGQYGRGKTHTPSYNAVFGQSFDQEFSCWKEEAGNCFTVCDRLEVRSIISVFQLSGVPVTHIELDRCGGVVGHKR
jgi:transposase InsO family protein